MKIKQILVMFIILLIIWMVLNNSLKIEIWISGVLISLVLSLLLCRRCAVFDDLKLNPKALLYTILFLFVFLFELVKANLDIALRVISPSLPIHPAIIRAKTSLKSPMARLILANAITLTPGTFTLDILDDTLYIHCVNLGNVEPERFSSQTIRKFEKYLEVIYG